MAMASSRPFANANFPSSPSPTTSSLNYSQYGANSFSSPSRHGPVPSVSSSSYSSRQYPPRQGTGLRPSNGPGPGSGSGKPDSREVARNHYGALKDFLREWLERESPTTRAGAREKLTKLTKLQFQELSTDVYDELLRRIDVDNSPAGQAAPFLAVRDDFHPKRNQARQKLATLPSNRFRDLASDVFYELRRRFPEFDEAEATETVFDEDPPPAPGPTSMRRGGPTPPPIPSSHQRQGSRNVSGSSSRSQPMRNGSRDYMNRSGGGGDYGGAPNLTSATNDTVIPNRSRLKEEDIKVPYSRDSELPSSASRQPGQLDRPTNDIVIPNKSRLREENVEVPFSLEKEESSGSRRGNGMVDRPTNDVVVPNKSRMREEEIEVPYARESRIIDRPRSSASSRPQSRNSMLIDRTRIGGGSGGSGDAGVLSPGTADDREYYDRMSFSSNVTSKSRPGGTGWDEEREQKLRSEYEFRIAGLERKVSVAEGERDEMKKQITDHEMRRKDDDDEIRGLKERAALHASSLRSMQHELDIARDSTDTARKHTETSSRQAQDEIEQWRERCDRLEDELRRAEEERSALEASNSAMGPNSDEAVEQLRREIHTLVDELQSLSARNEDLVAEREKDAQAMNDMEGKVEEYKRLYDGARVELRNLKATSMMFVPKPASDDHLPASPDGNIADLNVLAFQTAIDGLLSAARSSAPSGVLQAMKSVVEAVTEIGDDVKQFEANPNLDVDASRLESLKYESTTRLNSLMQTARSHAMSSGLSPISLIDGAAGHLSNNVVEIIKLLKIRRSGDQPMQRKRSSLSIKDMVDRTRAGNSTPTDLRRGAATPSELYDGRSGTPSEMTTSSSFRGRDFGSEEKLRDPYKVSPRKYDNGPSGYNSAPRSAEKERVLSPIDTRMNGGPMSAPAANPNLRTNSYQSSASSIAKSDSFDLDRKPSITSERYNSSTPTSRDPIESLRNGYGRDRNGPSSVTGSGRNSPAVSNLGSKGMNGPSGPTPTTASSGRSGGFSRDDDELLTGKGGTEEEWEEVKPYLETQSSSLVNSIQNLLAAIRTGGQTPALNEHLSEVIAISSSIVAVSTNSLPAAYRGEGNPLLKDLISNTNKLSEAQEQAKGGNFDKAMRQVIASASFGVAKSLKALMKLGTE